MALVTIHNVSDRPNVESRPRSLMIGGRKLRPGKSMNIDSSAVGPRLRSLPYLVFGEVPRHLRATSRAGLSRAESPDSGTKPMDLHEVRELFRGMDLVQLRELGRAVTPPFAISETSSKSAAVARLSRVLFQDSRILDPETFFFLRRWKQVNGSYVPKG